jgi:putative SOS response-associated peptidase YedK
MAVRADPSRKPVILPQATSRGLIRETENGNLKELLVPYPANQMRTWKIAPRINSPKNDDPSLWEPVHVQPGALELL